MRKIALVVIPLLFIASVVFSFHPLFRSDIDIIGYAFFGMFMMFSIGSMFVLGTFRKTGWGRGAYFGIAITCIALLFKLQHWVGGALFLVVGLVLIGIFYLIYFLTKRPKRLLDWLKVIYLVSVAAGLPLMQNRLFLYPLQARWIIFVSGMVLVIAFYISLVKNKRKDPVEISGEDQQVFRYID
jgi:hypothetical protein